MSVHKLSFERTWNYKYMEMFMFDCGMNCLCVDPKISYIPHLTKSEQNSSDFIIPHKGTNYFYHQFFFYVLGKIFQLFNSKSKSFLGSLYCSDVMSNISANQFCLPSNYGQLWPKLTAFSSSLSPLAVLSYHSQCNSYPYISFLLQSLF